MSENLEFPDFPKPLELAETVAFSLLSKVISLCLIAMKDSLWGLLHRAMFNLLKICTTIPHCLYTNSLGEKYISVTKMKYLASPKNCRTQLILTSRKQENMCELWCTWGDV